LRSDENLVLLRHGQSVYNQERRFTGWADVGLSPTGEAEARRAGRLLRSQGLEYDIAFASLLKRAIKTLWLVSEEMELEWVPIVKAVELNERHHGELQGRTRDAVAAQGGEVQGRPGGLGRLRVGKLSHRRQGGDASESPEFVQNSPRPP